MTLRHTRELVRCPMKHLILRDDCRYCRDVRAALAEVSRAEAVIEAARAQVNAEGRVTEEHHRLVDALAALDAAQKARQTACPCDGTDCGAEYPPPCPHCGFGDCVC